MLDPVSQRRELLKEAERKSEARRSAPMKPRGVFPYDVWMARLGDKLIRLGMKLKTRPGTEVYGPGLNIG